MPFGSARLPGTGPPFPDRAEIPVAEVRDYLLNRERPGGLRGGHPTFTRSVRAALGEMRFRPAGRAGSVVRRLVARRFRVRVAPALEVVHRERCAGSQHAGSRLRDRGTGSRSEATRHGMP
jgi:hypothetical protein